MTRELLNSLSEPIRNRIEYLKENASDPRYRELYVNKALGYIEGLRDAGVITENERKAIFCYVSLSAK